MWGAAESLLDSPPLHRCFGTSCGHALVLLWLQDGGGRRNAGRLKGCSCPVIKKALAHPSRVSYLLVIKVVISSTYQWSKVNRWNVEGLKSISSNKFKHINWLDRNGSTFLFVVHHRLAIYTINAMTVVATCPLARRCHPRLQCHHRVLFPSTWSTHHQHQQRHVKLSTSHILQPQKAFPFSISSTTTTT